MSNPSHLNKELESAIKKAFHIAKEEHHELITIEHLLLQMIDEKGCQTTLDVFKVDTKALKQQLKSWISQHVGIHDPSNFPNEEVPLPDPLPSFQEAIQGALLVIKNRGENQITLNDILIQIMSQKTSQAAKLLRDQGLTKIDLVNYVTKGVKPGEQQQETASAEGEESEQGDKSDPLTAFTSNLNKAATDGKIDPLIGRDREIERVIQILSRRRKNNPILVGEAGVGKTAIAEGLAWRIVNGQVPEVLKDCEVFSLDIGSLVAGTKYRGDFEARIKALLNKVKGDTKKIMFIDEIHTLIGAGAASGNNMDASNLLKTALAKGEMRSIGATTYGEYRRIFEQEHAIARRFQKIDVSEPTVEHTIGILKGLQSRFEDHHNVKYTEEAVIAAAQLAARHITTGHMPDKAIDVFDEAGAYQRTQPADKAKKIIDAQDIADTISKIAGVPATNIKSSDKDKLRNLGQEIKSAVFEQDPAVDALTMAVKRSKVSQAERTKPVGSFLFTGPTGVGKTEVCKQLAKVLGLPLVRFDMSEYMEKHSVSRLIGAPSGYVGYDEGGLLTEAISKQPYCVLLLDEIEKAHPDIFNILLQVMDHGKLTDNKGRVAYFKNAIVVMTSNVGAQSQEKNTIGFTGSSSDAREDERNKAMKQIFSPEFRNRLDATINFRAATPTMISSVVDKFLTQYDLELQEREFPVTATYSAPLKQHLAKIGFDPLMGARPLARVVQEQISNLVVDELLFGQLEFGGEVEFDVIGEPGKKDSKIKFSITQSNPDPKKVEADKQNAEEAQSLIEEVVPKTRAKRSKP